MKAIYLTIPALAIPKGRARVGRHGMYTPKKTTSFEAELRWHWTQSKHQMIPQAPTFVIIQCYFPYPKSLAKKKLRPVHPITKPDLDNVLKAIMDSMNGFAWKDDNQVCSVTMAKYYTPESPRIEMIIRWEAE
jgi:Holliday junction resolvase RusA-like endonuclease